MYNVIPVDTQNPYGLSDPSTCYILSEAFRLKPTYIPSTYVSGYNETYEDNRGSRSGRVAGRNTMPPKFMEEVCSIPDEPTCNPAHMYRTIMGECNNLG